MAAIQEKMCTLTELAEKLSEEHGRADRPYSPSTLWRWANRGVGGVRLQTKKVGGTLMASYEALQRFLGQINEAN